jgi:hypothetical protein
MLAYLLFVVIALVAIGLVLLPLALISGLWAILSARDLGRQIRAIERLLANDQRHANH